MRGRIGRWRAAGAGVGGRPPQPARVGSGAGLRVGVGRQAARLAAGLAAVFAAGLPLRDGGLRGFVGVDLVDFTRACFALVGSPQRGWAAWSALASGRDVTEGSLLASAFDAGGVPPDAAFL